ncbi:MAG TPA: amidohydrolase family protein [Chitinophagaceae bacterium]
MRKLMLLFQGLLFFVLSQAQETFPQAGVADPRSGYYAFTNATLVKDAETTLQNATLIIREGKIIAAGSGIAIPKDAVLVDLKGRYIYPSFIDLYSDYGIAVPQRGQGGFNFNAPPQTTSNTKGAYNWNQAIHPETDGVRLFQVNETRAKELRGAGFGSVLTHQQDGIARGSGTFVTLSSGKENLAVLKEKASAHYSFDKGSSTQDYPGSLMGVISLIRQTYLDAQWYKKRPVTEGVNLSLQAWNELQSLPQVMESSNKWNALRADKIAKEFGVHYIIKGSGDEYQRLDDIRKIQTAFILPLNFPAAMDVEDPNDARVVAYADMKHWEMAPANPGFFEKAGISFALTATGTAVNDFLPNVRKAIQYGLSPSAALEALTRTPARLVGMFDQVGSLEAGKIANFLITSGPIFNDTTSILQNWIQGERYAVKESAIDYRGVYTLSVRTKGQTTNYDAFLRGTPGNYTATVQRPGDTTVNPLNLSLNEMMVRLNWANRNDISSQTILTGIARGDGWYGNGYLNTGDPVQWSMTFRSALPTDTTRRSDTSRRGGSRRPVTPPTLDDVVYPFTAFGNKQLPVQEDLLIRNATVWTNEKQGRLDNTDVLVRGGKIAAIGKNLAAGSARVIDGTGKHLTAGIIDEHSHIAVTGGVNECTQSITAEVRVGDALNPDDINIYRQLSGGVTSSHLLHGSCNTIGGQTQLVKLRWGRGMEEMKFLNWDPFIKFALGENVKRSSSNQNTRFPDTRMGVEQVLMDGFQRAADYRNAGAGKRRDLELETLVEIMEKKRFITAHSYVQSEINMLMKVAEKFGFTVNTFTHILEGYKVADKMKQHGAAASTFSDWWAYKMEVKDAIPYNAAIMNRVGLNVAINSDDAEMARRLNQEAAKTIKYGGLTEEEALKMVTLNPATMLHVADRVGSISVGKDADLVLWSDNPLSIYAMSLYTIVDGIVYFDRAKDNLMRQWLSAERNRLIQKMIAEKRAPGGAARMTPARPRMEEINECELDHRHKRSVLDRDEDDNLINN